MTLSLAVVPSVTVRYVLHMRPHAAQLLKGLWLTALVYFGNKIATQMCSWLRRETSNIQRQYERPSELLRKGREWMTGLCRFQTIVCNQKPPKMHMSRVFNPPTPSGCRTTITVPGAT